MLVGAYLPGTSWLHRARAGVKLAVLAAGLLGLALLHTPWAPAAAAVLLGGLAASAGIGGRALFGQLRPVLVVAVVVATVQFWLAGPGGALTVTGSLLVAVAAAGLVTLTTRTEDLLDAVIGCLRPLRRLGVDPERVALVLALAIRTVPVLAGLAREVHEARMARGATRSMRALAVPLVIRALRHADRLGEALAARGVDDE